MRISFDGGQSHDLTEQEAAELEKEKAAKK